jgi:D-alanyl-D-alanine carboxypeptidase (penicillin-binding protein 5/6)
VLDGIFIFFFASWRRVAATVGVALLATLALLAGCSSSAGPHTARIDPSLGALQSANGPITKHIPGQLNLKLSDPLDTVKQPFKVEPSAGILFDLKTGKVLWRRNPTKVLPIASLTKMMTALLVVAHVPEGSTVRITKQALAYQGSGVGVLPYGKWIGVSTMLNGLLLPSGNDAAIALAQKVSKTVPAFVAQMNRRAAAMGLTCTHYSSPSGFYDAHNHSCAADLAVEARAVLNQPRLAAIVKRKQAVMKFPIKGHKLYLYNNNPLLKDNYPGTIGLKTGYTDAAGMCLVAAVQRGSKRYGLVLLHTPNWQTQAEALFNRAFHSTT